MTNLHVASPTTVHMHAHRLSYQPGKANLQVGQNILQVIHVSTRQVILWCISFSLRGWESKRVYGPSKLFHLFWAQPISMLGKIKRSLCKKKKITHQNTCTFHINTRAIFPAFAPSDFSLWFWKAPQFKSKVLIFIQCDFQNYITASLLFTNPDFSGWVGRHSVGIFFGSLSK